MVCYVLLLRGCGCSAYLDSHGRHTRRRHTLALQANAACYLTRRLDLQRQHTQRKHVVLEGGCCWLLSTHRVQEGGSITMCNESSDVCTANRARASYRRKRSVTQELPKLLSLPRSHHHCTYNAKCRTAALHSHGITHTNRSHDSRPWPPVHPPTRS